MRKVFILGAHRSGTTKLGYYFAQFLKFEGIGESHVFRFMAAIENERENIINSIPPNAYVVNRIGFDNIIRSLTLTLDGLQSDLYGGDYFDKTPGEDMIRASRYIRAYVPDCYFIHIDRNGMHNVASNLRLWKRRRFSKACEMWANSIDAYLSVKEALEPRVLDLKMDDLLTEPLVLHRKICAFLGIEDKYADADVLKFLNAPSKTVTRALATEGESSSRISDMGWTKEQCEVFENVCGKQMRALGYEF